MLRESHREVRVSTIKRIADLVWEEYVFEIQVSPISLSEAQARIRDYQKAGYKVIFLLHDRRYNRSFLTSSEAYLRHTKNAYYAHADPRGEVFIYDQYEKVSGKRRILKSPPLPVDLDRPYGKGFSGDLSNRYEALSPWIEKVEERMGSKSTLFQKIQQHYCHFLDTLVTRFSPKNRAAEQTDSSGSRESREGQQNLK
jgi:hypothetical protein